MALFSSQNIGIIFCILSMARDIEKKEKRLDYSLLLFILIVMTPLVIDPAKDSRLCSICIREIRIFQFPCTYFSALLKD